ncbi:hypothetical protein [Bosea sp. TND4EK4]|uniref:hypothetical protein n=1 Tax=Bosea sp. TND4EK4 TaxID=1907408 RepID=UPI00095573BF|nr:hypothetical protein [Bosea sp. TND4EK4]SIQ22053.1 hypothetical protein SAMN05880592_10256 [Bosea sp. TND4EK4]
MARKLIPAAAMAPGLAGCAMPMAGPIPGTVDDAAATVSRAYDCRLRVDRGRVLARFDRQQRPSFIAASASHAVKSYKAPHACGAAERERVAGELTALARR